MFSLSARLIISNGRQNEHYNIIAWSKYIDVESDRHVWHELTNIASMFYNDFQEVFHADISITNKYSSAYMQTMTLSSQFQATYAWKTWKPLPHLGIIEQL